MSVLNKKSSFKDISIEKDNLSFEDLSVKKQEVDRKKQIKKTAFMRFTAPKKS